MVLMVEVVEVEVVLMVKVEVVVLTEEEVEEVVGWWRWPQYRDPGSWCCRRTLLDRRSRPDLTGRREPR